jgi:hypothetical protein
MVAELRRKRKDHEFHAALSTYCVALFSAV